MGGWLPGMKFPISIRQKRRNEHLLTIIFLLWWFPLQLELMWSSCPRPRSNGLQEPYGSQCFVLLSGSCIIGDQRTEHHWRGTHGWWKIMDAKRFLSDVLSVSCSNRGAAFGTSRGFYSHEKKVGWTHWTGRNFSRFPLKRGQPIVG